MQRNGFRHEVAETILQVLSVRLITDGLDGHREEQAVLLIGVAHVDFFRAEAALKRAFTGTADQRLCSMKTDCTKSISDCVGEGAR